MTEAPRLPYTDRQEAGEVLAVAFDGAAQDVFGLVVAQGPDGALWLLEDSSPGRLLRLAPKH